jgi:hypothetical protein
MNNKVGLITIHYVDNLGGVLLAYALQDVIKRFGYDCRIIDFDPTVVPSRTSHLARSIARRVVRMHLYLSQFPYYFGLLAKNRGSVFPPRHKHKSVGLRKIRFDSFRQEHIKLSEQHYVSSGALSKSPPQYDAYVCGSDQIWNPFICKDPSEARNEPAYFLTFARETKRISYAPSIAIPSIPETLREEMAKMLHAIPHLSSREKQGAELIHALTGRNVEVVLDPTLLLNSDQWNKIAVDQSIEEPYILCYFLGDGMEYRNVAIELSKKLQHRLVVISRVNRDMSDHGAIDCSDAGPAEFIGLLKNASLVCTDSYHGTLFSINYEKPFYVFERPGSSGTESMVTRIVSILDLLELKSRLLRTGMPVPKMPMQIDYSKSRLLLDKNRRKSLRYLEDALLGVTNSGLRRRRHSVLHHGGELKSQGSN